MLTERTGGRQQRQQSQATLLVVLVVEEVLVNFVWRHTTSVIHPTANLLDNSSTRTINKRRHYL